MVTSRNRSTIRNPKSILPTETDSTEATLALGRRLAAHLGAGGVVALYGDLGTGKTHLVKGICAAYGVPEATVTSPTFTLVNEYAGKAFPIYHLDAYRIERLQEFFDLGYEQYFFGDGLCLIEWPVHIEDLLPEHTLRLRLTHLGGNRRRIVVEKGGEGEKGKGEEEKKEKGSR